jgi:Flp pilus assembly protein TadB
VSYQTFFGLLLGGLAVRLAALQVVRGFRRRATHLHQHASIASRFTLINRTWRRSQPIRLHGPISELARLTRDGLTLGHAIGVIASTATAPVGPWFHRIATDAELVGLEAALRQAARQGSSQTNGSPNDRKHPGRPSSAEADLARAAWVLALAAATGGPPSDALETLADTFRADDAVRREAVALTAQARLSAGVLATVPVGFCALMIGTDPQARGFLLNTTAGRLCAVVGLILDGLAWLWVRSLAGSGTTGPAGSQVAT